MGTNILTGPYRESNLRGAYEKAMDADSVDFVWITDFQPFQAAGGMPIAWLVSPINSGGKTNGVLALPLPISKINRIMTADQHWKAAGMGETAETYLAGPDGLMRSDSRLFLQDPKKYERDAVAAGTPPDIVAKAIRWHGTTLVQPVETEAFHAAQRGQTGTVVDTGYLGDHELAAYAPVSIPNSDLRWSILATRDSSEAYSRIESFTRTLIVTTATMVFVICVLAMLIAQVFVGPIRRLRAGAEEISAGNYDVTIPVTTRDEIGDLTSAFNEMSRNLQIKEGLLTEQRNENDRLLLSLMPEAVVQRYRDGEQTIAQEHQDVTVIFADIVGLDEISSTSVRRRIGRDRRRVDARTRLSGGNLWRRADSDRAQRLPRQLRTERPAAGQRAPHHRLRRRDAAHHRALQQRNGPPPQPSGPVSTRAT